MFDWFKGGKGEKSTNVLPFPNKKEGCDNCSLDSEPEVPEKPVTTFYRIGVTDKNRISFQMGYSELTMTKQGVQNLIDQLAVFRDQLVDEEQE